LAALYVPVPAYVLWIDFKRYSNSPAILLEPALVAVIAGYADQRRGPSHVALWLTAATYVVVIIDTALSAARGDLRWYEAPLVLGYAAFWMAAIVGIPTVFCAVLGRHIRRIRLSRP